jgi:hypothetical protein
LKLEICIISAALTARQKHDLQMVKIKFTDPAQEADGFVALSKRLRVICFPDQTYEIAKSGLKVLEELGIRYQVIAEEGFDRAYHALRNSPPTSDSLISGLWHRRFV